MPSSRKKNTNHFVVMWDRLGLECIFDVTNMIKEHNAWEKQKIVAILKEEREPIQPKGIPIQMMIIRAQANAHRNYEIYEFISELSEKEIKQFFQDSPQLIVNAIRDIGKPIYSNRVKKDDFVIT